MAREYSTLIVVLPTIWVRLALGLSRGRKNCACRLLVAMSKAQKSIEDSLNMMEYLYRRLQSAELMVHRLKSALQ
jgi:hypothetical protein